MTLANLARVAEGETRFLGVPVGDPRWLSAQSERVVLVVARTLAATARLVELLPELLSDRRVQLVFTIENESSSVFRQGAAEVLDELRIPVVPWSQAVGLPIDLVVAATHTGALGELGAPVVVLRHGLGIGKTDAVPADGRVPVSPRAGRSPGTVVTVSHSDDAGYFDCSDGSCEVVVVGDPVLDQLVESLRRRDIYRDDLGLDAEQVLVIASSSWGMGSQFSRLPDLISRLSSELPADEFKVAVVLHPNLWIGHSDFQIRVWLRDVLAAGVLLVPPKDAWKVALIASDVVVSDHGSVGLYAAAIGRAVLLAGYNDDDVMPGSAMELLGEFAPRLRAFDSVHDAVTTALFSLDQQGQRDICQRAAAFPGEALDRIQRVLYEVLGLDPNSRPPRTLAVQRWRPEPTEVDAWVVETNVAAWDGRDSIQVTLRRYGASTPPPEKMYRCGTLSSTQRVATASYCGRRQSSCHRRNQGRCSMHDRACSPRCRVTQVAG